MRFLRVLSICLFAAIGALALGQNFTIESYDVAIKLNADRTMHVTETIGARFNVQSRGIIRNIPYRYDTDKGFFRNIFLRNVTAVEKGNIRIPVKIWRENDQLNIRTGDKDVFFDAGTRKTYVISYDVSGMLNWFELDAWEPTVELYWNIHGDQWDTNIERATFRVEYPAEQEAFVAAKLFYGPYGSRTFVEQKSGTTAFSPDGAISLSAQNGSVSGEAKNGFGIREGWSLVLALKESAIPKPTFVQEAFDFVRANPIILAPLLTIIFLTFFWYMNGRDPKPGPMVVQFDPPHDLTAAQAGSLLDEKVDRRDIAAGFVDLAARGFLTISIEEKQGLFGSEKATLELTGKTDKSGLSPFESELLDKLESCGAGPIGDIELKTKVGPHISALTGSIYQSLIERGYYRWNPNTVRGCFTAVGFLFLVGACLGGPFLGLGGVAMTFASLAVSAIAFFIFARIMPRRTPGGVKAWNDVRGLEEFIRRARSDELDWLSKNHPDQALFEKMLPYAVAFGLTKEWADAFKNIELTAPHWYHSPYGYHFNPYTFSNSLENSTGSLAAAASTPPRSSGASGGSSGFGGGGFSGGGFGGGGGSSW